jgi:hypothetical protein
VGKASYLGTELKAGSSRGRPLSIDFSYVYLDARDRSPNRTSGRLPDRPAHKLHGGGLGRLGSGFQDARTAHGVASVCAAVVAVVVAEGVTATIVMSDAEMESTTVTGERGAARGIGERGAERGRLVATYRY